MTPLSFRGQSCYLLDLPPDWGQGVRATVKLLSQTESSLSNREGRRPHSASLRWKCEFTIRASGSEARRLAAALKGYQTQPILLPFWPGAVRWTDRANAPLTGGLHAALNMDLTRVELYHLAGGVRYWTHKAVDGTVTSGSDSDPEPAWPTGADTYLPVLMGRLEKTEPIWETADRCRFEVEFVEASPVEYAMTPAAGSFAAGPRPGDAWSVAPYLLPLACDFAETREKFTTSIGRDSLGFGRQPAETLYPQTTAREIQTAHTLVLNSELAGLLDFFRLHGGGRPFWAYHARALLQLAEQIGQGQTELVVEDLTDVAVGDFLAFVRAGELISTACVMAKNADAKTVTLDAAPGEFGPLDLVARLSLVRFLKPEIKLTWLNYGLAQATLDLREVPPEIEPPADETLGETLGLLPTRCYLYEFSANLGGIAFTEYLTSYEQNLTCASTLYSAAKIQHGEIKHGLALEQDEVQIETDLGASSFLRRLAMTKLSAPLYLRILSAETVGDLASNVNVLFAGEVTKITVTGSRLTARASSGGSALDRKLPSFLIGPMCNWSVFSAGCGLSADDWKFNAKIKDPGQPGFPFTFELKELTRVSGPTPTYFTNWFAGGWIELGSGRDWQRLPILTSSLPSGGIFTVTLSRDPDPFPEIDDPVVLYPGCDGRPETCRAYHAQTNPEGKFNNYLNFGGHPFVPTANPSLVRQEQKAMTKK